MSKLRVRVKQLIQRATGINELQRAVYSDIDMRIVDKWKRDQNSHPNPLNRFGQKCFSQSDEDGITLEIIRRVGLEAGTFAELGVGSGLANNTLILLAIGWKGLWLGGQELVIDHEASQRLTFIRDWISLDSIDELFRAGLESNSIDVVSLDLDGNDIYFAEHILEHLARPALFIVEYNGKFPPPVHFSIPYNQDHTWKGDDYFGASLQSFFDLFDNHGYFLACCNSATGANAFFIRDEFRAQFTDVPKDIRDIFVPPNYRNPTNYGHPESVKTVNRIIE